LSCKSSNKFNVGVVVGGLKDENRDKRPLDSSSKVWPNDFIVSIGDGQIIFVPLRFTNFLVWFLFVLYFLLWLFCFCFCLLLLFLLIVLLLSLSLVYWVLLYELVNYIVNFDVIVGWFNCDLLLHRLLFGNNCWFLENGIDFLWAQLDLIGVYILLFGELLDQSQPNPMRVRNQLQAFNHFYIYMDIFTYQIKNNIL
jgi:hypothetical protein